MKLRSDLIFICLVPALLHSACSDGDRRTNDDTAPLSTLEDPPDPPPPPPGPVPIACCRKGDFGQVGERIWWIYAPPIPPSEMATQQICEANGGIWVTPQTGTVDNTTTTCLPHMQPPTPLPPQCRCPINEGGNDVAGTRLVYEITSNPCPDQSLFNDQGVFACPVAECKYRQVYPDGVPGNEMTTSCTGPQTTPMMN